MRTEEQTKSGFFWLPSNPEKKFPGTLTIFDGGKIVLNSIGLSAVDNLVMEFRKLKNPDCKKFSMGSYVKIPRIIGLVENNILTLDECVSPEFTPFSIPGTSKCTVHVNRVFMGVAFDENEPVNIEKMWFTVDGIDEWVSKSGIKVITDQNFCFDKLVYSSLNEPTFNLKNGMQIKVVFEVSYPSITCLTEAKISQKAYFQLSSEYEKPFDEFISLAEKITSFVVFGTNKVLSIQDVTIASNAIVHNVFSGNTASTLIKCFYQSSSFSKNIPKLDQHSMLFTYPQITNDMETIINNWLNNYEMVAPSMYLYFSYKNEGHKFLEGKFLALAQGLETYHRRKSTETLRRPEVYECLKSEIMASCPADEKEWLENMLAHGNEINFRKRLKRIIEPYKNFFGNCNQRDELVGKIYDTRNYLTHYDKSLESRSAKGQDLWLLCSNMEAIYQLSFLYDLGFSTYHITQIYENKIKRMLSLKTASH